MERMFSSYQGPFKLNDIIDKVLPGYEYDITFHDILITGVDSIENANKNEVTYLSNKSYLNDPLSINAAACFVTDDLQHLLPTDTKPIITNFPESIIADVINLFYKDINLTQTNKISNLAYLDKDVYLEESVTINPSAVIKKGVSIGKNTLIDSNTVIGSNVSLGRNVSIGSNCSIKNCIIGDNVIIHPGVCIGQDGFGYVKNNKTYLKKFPHIGKVIVQNDTEIGANSSIDRGSINDTIIGQGTKIDNQVQIAHNVIIGESCAIAGQVGISGSVKIGNNVMIGGKAGIKQHTIIGDNVIIAAGAAVNRSFPSNKKIAGNPAQEIDLYHHELKTISRLIRK